MNGKRVSLPVRKGLAYLQTVADNSRQFGSPYPILSLPATCLLLSGVETSLAAASSRDRGAQRWGPKSSPRGEEGCSLAGDSFLCVSLPYDVLRRLLRGNLRYTANASSSTDSFCARARRGHATSAGSRGTPVSARRKAGLPLARVAGLGAFASLSCSGSSPELEKGIKRSAGSGAVIVRVMHRQKSGYVSPFAQRSKMTGGRGSIVLANGKMFHEERYTI